jgi:uncharacterized protein YukE
MTTQHNVNISTEEVGRIEKIVADAMDRMASSAVKVHSQADASAVAYRGSGTATVVDSFTNLGGAGKALSNALNGLLSDLGATNATAHEMDASTAQAARAGAADLTVTSGM